MREDPTQTPLLGAIRHTMCRFYDDPLLFLIHRGEPCNFNKLLEQERITKCASPYHLKSVINNNITKTEKRNKMTQTNVLPRWQSCQCTNRNNPFTGRPMHIVKDEWKWMLVVLQVIWNHQGLNHGNSKISNKWNYKGYHYCNWCWTLRIFCFFTCKRFNLFARSIIIYTHKLCYLI